MKFLEEDPEYPDKLRTQYHKLKVDIQLTLAELEHRLAKYGYELTLLHVGNRKLNVEIGVIDEDQGSIDLFN